MCQSEKSMDRGNERGGETLGQVILFYTGVTSMADSYCIVGVRFKLVQAFFPPR